MTTTNEDLELAGDPDAQQDDPEASFDINQQFPDAIGMVVDPDDVVSLAKAVQAGVPIGKLAAVHETALSTHTWTPGDECPMRSRNRKVGSLVSVYSLDHLMATHHAPADLPDVHWLARCETHEADFYSRTFGPAWKARNRPWDFCSECQAIFTQRYGKGQPKKAVRRGKKLNTVAVAPPKPKADLNEAPASLAANEALADVVLSEDAPQAAQEAAPAVTPAANDPEEAVWNEWSQKLAKQAPVGATIDWVSDYYYQVHLKDGRAIDLRVHKGEGTFRFRDASGHDHYTDDLPAMLAEIG